MKIIIRVICGIAIQGNLKFIDNNFLLGGDCFIVQAVDGFQFSSYTMTFWFQMREEVVSFSTPFRKPEEELCE